MRALTMWTSWLFCKILVIGSSHVQVYANTLDSPTSSTNLNQKRAYAPGKRTPIFNDLCKTQHAPSYASDEHVSKKCHSLLGFSASCLYNTAPLSRPFLDFDCNTGEFCEMVDSTGHVFRNDTNSITTTVLCITEAQKDEQTLPGNAALANDYRTDDITPDAAATLFYGSIYVSGNASDVSFTATWLMGTGNETVENFEAILVRKYPVGTMENVLLQISYGMPVVSAGPNGGVKPRFATMVEFDGYQHLYNITVRTSFGWV